MGDCSSHSPGCRGAATLIEFSREASIPMASAVTAVSGPGADPDGNGHRNYKKDRGDHHGLPKKNRLREGDDASNWQRLLGRLAAFACSCAADEESPIAHVAPRPKYAAAAAAR